MRVVVAFVVAVALAGCSDGSPGTEDVQEITSGSSADQTVESDGGPTLLPSGGVTGIVVDPSYHPIEGAIVRLPGMDRETRSDEDGRFGLSNVPAGQTFMQAERQDYHPVSLELSVPAGDIVDVRLIMDPDVREPYVRLQAFEGYAEYSGDMLFGSGSLTCPTCTFQVNLEPGAEWTAIEVASDRTGSTDPTGLTDDQRFYYTVTPLGQSRTMSGYEWDPFRLDWDADTTADHTSFKLTVYPNDLVPQPAVSFQVFVATFHDGADPERWSILEGRP